jgi:RimJ/RimL family protein N-acetyltransferase
MKIIAETERLIIREADICDIDDWFEMDSDPEVHRYIERKPVKSKDETQKIINIVKDRYRERGMSRWSVVEKVTNECIGWCGISIYKNLNGHEIAYDHGYRFKRKHWGKGFATEASFAVLDYGFTSLELTTINAMIDPDNDASRNVLHKLGFIEDGSFYFMDMKCDWFELNKESYVNKLSDKK